MDVDEDDDFYAPEEGADETAEQAEKVEAAPPAEAKPEQEGEDEDLEEGEEEEEAESDDSDSDIDIITERKDGTKAAPPSQPKYNEIRNISQRTAGNEVVAKPALEKKGKGVKKETTPQVSGADLPGISTSKIDVNAKPIYAPAGKPITQVNIDEDLNENDKPWRRPGTDISDYFNYGFDEFTWALYASKQDSVRSEFSPEKMAANQKKMLDDMNMMMSMGAMPGMIPGAPGGGMPGMEGMTPEMLQQMQQMMGAGMDPSQMDPAAMFGQGGAGGGAQGGQNFGGQGFNQGQNQYGYDQGMANSGGDNRNRGGNFGRGRGGRRGGGGW